MKLLLLFLISICGYGVAAQKTLLKIASPKNTSSSVIHNRDFITGITCTSCTVTINDTLVTVYKTGAFAYEAKLKEGENIFNVVAKEGKKSTMSRISFLYQPAQPEQAVINPDIERIKVFPDGNLLLPPGEKINIEIKAQPGGKVYFDNQPLFEAPVDNEISIRGIYKGVFKIPDSGTTVAKKPKALLIIPNGDSISKTYHYTIGALQMNQPMVVRTKGRLAFLKYGLGEDRLGGAKLGYIDSLINLEVTGKIKNEYRVKLANGVSAYIEDEWVDTLLTGTTISTALTGKWQVYGDDSFDYVKVELGRRLPYFSQTKLNPAQILIDVYGAVNNTNWISQLQSAKEIDQVSYKQTADGVYQISITLKHHQPWGYFIYYEGNILVIKVRRPPLHNALKGLVIGVDAGHGGRNTGGVGITGAIEKNICLDIALELKKQLEQEGARVIMTRNKEQFFDNRERILFFRDSLPDVLLSIHLNSSANPIEAKGTGAFYRHEGYKPLSVALQNRMLELGLSDYGINGSFNFMLNSPTEYPNVLAEVLFLSNPAEEEMILNDLFRKRVATKMVLAVKDFVKQGVAE
ncbi:MAG: N-acetylmuramoyl-L-alanine amidase [Ferruginibacter sp.]|nr:N-acetylmuramoyl-L-alanine amidase [Ferruginibacter sp.]